MNYNKILRVYYLFVLVTNTNTPVVPDPCQPNKCLHGGTCTVNDADFTCNCNTGFTGKDCSTTGKTLRISCFRLQQLKYLMSARHSPVLAISLVLCFLNLSTKRKRMFVATLFHILCYMYLSQRGKCASFDIPLSTYLQLYTTYDIRCSRMHHSTFGITVFFYRTNNQVFVFFFSTIP